MHHHDSPFELLRGLISERKLKPGDRVPSIRELSRIFGLSLVAVRDGLVQAEREGLVEIRPRLGAFVREGGQAESEGLQSADLRVVDGNQLHLCHAREILEVKIAGLAAARCRPAELLPVREALDAWLRGRNSGDFEAVVEADCRFHLALARMAGNPVVARLLTLCLQQQYMQECWLIENRDEQEEMVAIHTGIYEAVCNRDVRRAREMMLRHMKHVEELIHRMVLRAPLSGDELPSAETARGKRS